MAQWVVPKTRPDNISRVNFKGGDDVIEQFRKVGASFHTGDYRGTIWHSSITIERHHADVQIKNERLITINIIVSVLKRNIQSFRQRLYFYRNSREVEAKSLWLGFDGDGSDIHYVLLRFSRIPDYLKQSPTPAEYRRA
ncbi:hypothetical protein [Niveispirillum sp.]|uniref:hypothetical protein n=1 Tax=Niveispirillum sp. TaxID=1917217 RepID=UPI001B684777|nr:hypothetical protein [Niveispirillum sp.]MBP7339810.1 hypothetical protein [Niveispirillum sp.]